MENKNAYLMREDNLMIPEFVVLDTADDNLGRSHEVGKIQLSGNNERLMDPERSIDVRWWNFALVNTTDRYGKVRFCVTMKSRLLLSVIGTNLVTFNAHSSRYPPFQAVSFKESGAVRLRHTNQPFSQIIRSGLRWYQSYRQDFAVVPYTWRDFP